MNFLLGTANSCNICLEVNACSAICMSFFFFFPFCGPATLHLAKVNELLGNPWSIFDHNTIDVLSHPLLYAQVLPLIMGSCVLYSLYFFHITYGYLNKHFGFFHTVPSSMKWACMHSQYNTLFCVTILQLNVNSWHFLSWLKKNSFRCA